MKRKVETKYLNKILSAVLIFLIILMQTIVFPIQSKAEEEIIYTGITLTMEPVTSLNAGDKVVVKLSTTGEKISHFDAYITYDMDVFEIITEDDIECLAKNWGVDQIEYDQDEEDYYGKNTGGLILANSKAQSTSGDIAKITLTLKKSVTSVSFGMKEIYVVLDNNDSAYQEGELECNAKLARKYTITYNANTTETVTGMPSNGEKSDGTDYTIAGGPTRANYTFKGWNTNSNGTGTAYPAGSTYNKNEDLTLYAQWEINQATLTVNPNGGTWNGSSSNQTFTQGYGTTKTIPNPTKSPNGYIVKFNSNGGTTDTLQTTSTKSFKNWTLTGGGRLSGTTYTFADKTGTLTANYTEDSITLPSATKTGATFKGWYTATTGGTRVGDAGDNYTPTSAITLSAQWEENEYTLTVNPNGGTWNGSSSNQTVKGKYNSTTAITNPTAPNGYIVTLNDNGETSQIQQTMNFDSWVATGSGSISGIVYTFGSGDGQLTATYTYNNVELPVPTKTGYTFDGWYTLSSGGTKVNTPYKPTSNVTLYAHWRANEYTITFNPGDKGTVSPTSKKVTYDQKYGTLPIPVREGYVFDGWEDETGNKVDSNQIVKITENTTLTAKWLGAEYTVTFNPDGGEVTPTSKKVQNEGKYGELPTPTKTGYTFNGWYNVSGTKIESTTTVNLTSDETLTARWNAVKSTLTVNPNGGTWEGSSETQTFTQDYNTTKNIPNPTSPKGYTVKFDGNGGESEQSELTQSKAFDNWTLTGAGNFAGTTYTFADKEGTLTANYIDNSITLPTVTKTGATFKGWYTEKTGGTKAGDVGENYKTTSDITLYAQWEEVKYTLTIDPKGGTINGNTNKKTVEGGYNSTTEVETPVAPNKYKVTLDNEGNKTDIMQTTTFAGWKVKTGTGTISNSTYTFGTDNGEIEATYTENNVELPTPSKTGYTFDGWYTEKTGGTKVNTPYKPTSNVTLYAHWTANEYTITFNPGDKATVSSTSKKVTYDQTYGELPTPVREGYTFVGWFNSSDNKIENTTIVKITGDETLTAKWLGAEYTVTFNSDGGEVTPTSKKVQNEGKYGELPTPTKTGYTFNGWYNVSGTKIESTTTVNLTSDETLTARWNAVKSTLTVNPNGGTWEGSSETQTFTQDYNTTKNIPNPTSPKGYTVKFDGNGGESEQSELTQSKAFDNWTLTGAGNFAGTTYTFADKEGTLTANYTENDITLPNVTKEGAIFKGWYTAKNDGTKIGNVGENYKATSDITLYAHWEEIKYTLTIDPNGGTINGSTEKKTVEGGYRTTTEIETPVAPNKYKVTLDDGENTTDIMQTTTFVGWTVKTGTGTISNSTYTFGKDDGEIIATYTENNVELPTLEKEGYTFDGWYTEKTDGTKINTKYVVPTEDVTLYAHWTANEYTVTFNPGSEATLDTTTKKVTYNQPYGELPTPEKEGYTFIGWFDSSDNKIESETIVKINADTTLTAKYEVKKYTVTYKNDDGSILATEEVEYGKNAEYTGETPIKENVQPGYEGKFIGWDDESKLQNIKQDITVTAKYDIVLKVYTIKYRNIKESDNSANPTTYTIEDSNIKLVDLQNQGKFIFKGWYTEPDSSGIKVESIDTSKLENIILYAQWENDGLYLSSKTYKVGEKDIDNYEDGDIYLDKIRPDTTLSEFIDNCTTNGKITVINQNGKVLRNSDFVGTNMTIKVTKDDEEITMTAVVMGDLSGDGRTTAQDLATLNQAVLGMLDKELEGAVFKAADIDDNMRLTATDLAAVNGSILKITPLTYKK